MRWLGIDWDEGPVYQMQRLARYREIAERLIREGHAYYCYCSREELDAMREAVEHGAKLYACPDALQAQGIDRHALIPECSGLGGAVQFMARASYLRWRTLVY